MTAATLARAMDDLRANRITADEYRAIMRASRAADPDGHERRKFAAMGMVTGTLR